MTDRPRFTSISVYNHAQGHLSFWYPTEWQVLESAAPHTTVTLLPDAAAPATHITIEVQEFPGPVTAVDQPTIAEGIKAGLAQLVDCVLEQWRELDCAGAGELGDGKISSGTWGLEWVCTFIDAGERRKRRARLLFTNHHLYSIICQGGSEDQYAYWQSMFAYVLLTVGVNRFSTVEWAAQQTWEDV